MSEPTPGQPEYNPKAAAKADKAYRKAMRPFYKKKRVIIPAALVAVIGFSTAAGGGGDDTSGSDTVNTEDSASAPEAEAPKDAEAPKAAKPKYAGALDGDKVASAAGAPIELSGWTVTAGAIAKRGTPLGDVLCSDVSMTNNDDEQQEYNGLSWKLQTPNGNVQDITFIGDTDLTTGGLAPGGNVAKSVCFTDEAAGPGQYILSWQPDIFTSKDRGVWLNTL